MKAVRMPGMRFVPTAAHRLRRILSSAVSAAESCRKRHTGFWFLGLAYGVYMNVSGLSFLYPMIMSLVIYGGSLEFVTVTMLLSIAGGTVCYMLLVQFVF